MAHSIWQTTERRRKQQQYKKEKKRAVKKKKMSEKSPLKSSKIHLIDLICLSINHHAYMFNHSMFIGHRSTAILKTH